MSRRGPRPPTRHRMTREERLGRRSGFRARGLRLGPDQKRRLMQLAGGVAGLIVLLIALDRLLGSERPPAAGPGTPSFEELAAWQQTLELAVREGATAVGLRESWIVSHPPGSPEGDSLLTVIELRVPGDLYLEVLNLALSRAIGSCGGEIAQGVELNDARVELEVAHRGHRTHRLVLQRYSGYRRVVGRIGLIVDDWGRAAQSMAEGFVGLPIEWTAAVIPEPGVSGSQARYLTAQGIPLMVHLPMEPENGTDWDLGDGAIYAETSAAQVAERLDAALAETPGAVGINNHMGSLATTQRPVMRALMEALKERGLFFIDSRTTAATVGEEEAERAGVQWGSRDVFLDPEDDPAVIEGQLRTALEQARRNGSVIMIGHPRQTTLEVLRRLIPSVRSEGFEFVTVDRLLRRPGRTG